MRNKSVVNEAREIQIAVDLINLGALAAIAGRDPLEPRASAQALQGSQR